MSDEELLEYSAKIKLEADTILHDLENYGILYGEGSFEITGNYAYIMKNRKLNYPDQ